MRIARLLSVLMFFLPVVLNAQTPVADTQTPVAKAIQAVLDKQVADWNRGDIDAFAKGYKNSPDILFIGRTIHHGYAEMVANYHRNYPTKERMGVLSFTQLHVQPLDARFATVTGNYHLEVSAAAGGNHDGYFLLVCEKTLGWKIVRDDTTGLPQAGAQ